MITVICTNFQDFEGRPTGDRLVVWHWKFLCLVASAFLLGACSTDPPVESSQTSGIEEADSDASRTSGTAEGGDGQETQDVFKKSTDDTEDTGSEEDPEESDGEGDGEEGADEEGGDEEAGEAETTDPYAALMHPDKLEECHDQGLVYDRKSSSVSDPGTCHSANWPADYECDQVGIVGAFGGGEGIRTALADALGDDFAIDQCGVYGDGDPFIMLVKKFEDVNGDPSIDIRTFEPN